MQEILENVEIAASKKWHFTDPLWYWGSPSAKLNEIRRTSTTRDPQDLIQVEALLTRSLTNPVFTFPCWVRGGGKVLHPCVCFLSFFSEGNTYVANCWGACSEALKARWPCALPWSCSPFSPRWGSTRKVSAVRVLRRDFSRSRRTHEGWLLVSADDRWVGPWQDSSEESLNLLWGPCWAGPRLGDCAVRLSSAVSRRGTAQCTSLLLGWWLQTHTFQLFPQYVFSCQLYKDF